MVHIVRERTNTKEENYNSCQCLWQEAGMRNFKDYLQWYNNKDVVPTLKALQKMIKFYHDRNVDIL